MSYKRKEIFMDDPVRKKRVIWHELDRGNEWAVETIVDVTDIVELNKAQYAATDEHARWGKVGEVDALVARIPAHLYFSALRRGLFDPNDDKSLLSWVDSRDNLMWKVRPGRLI